MEQELQLQGKIYLSDGIILVEQPKDVECKKEPQVEYAPQIEYTPQEEKIVKEFNDYVDNEIDFISTQIFTNTIIQAKQIYNNIITKEVEECMEELIGRLVYEILSKDTNEDVIQELANLCVGERTTQMYEKYEQLALPIIDGILFDYQSLKVVFEKQPTTINENTIPYIIDMLLNSILTFTCNLGEVGFKEYYDDIKKTNKTIRFINDTAKLRNMTK